ncbi:MAG TPA: hypothetical protein ENG49_03970 [Candidatus Omnitrophica bacterium]|nr:hypothetical protein [Candidatus Omnitrophota bacterium]
MKKNIIEEIFRIGLEGLKESLLKTGPPSETAETQSLDNEKSVSQSSQEKIVVFVLQPSSGKEEKVEVLIKREGKILLLSFSKGEITFRINILNSEKENSVKEDSLKKEKEDDTVRVSTNDTVIEAIDLALLLFNNLNNSSDSPETVITLTKENGKTKAIVENLEENQVLDVALALLNKNIDVVEAKLKTQNGEVVLTFIRKENKREIAKAVDNKDVLTVVIDGNKWSVYSSEKTNKPSMALSTALSALAKNATEVKVELAEGFQITLRKKGSDTIVIDAGNIKDLATLINLTSLVVKESSQLDNFRKGQKGAERIVINGYELNVTAVFNPEEGEEGYYIFVNSKSENQTINSDNNKDIISSNSGEVYYISLASISDIQPSDNLWWGFKEKDITKASWFREPPTGIPKNASLIPVAFLTLTSKNSSQASIFGKSKESFGKVSDKVVDLPASATEFNIERLVNNIQEQNYLIWIVRGPPSIEFLVGSFSPASRLIDFSIIKNPFSIYNSAVDFVKKNVVIPEDKNPVIPQLNSLKGPNPTKTGKAIGIATNDIPHAIYDAICNFGDSVGKTAYSILSSLWDILSSLWRGKEESSSSQQITPQFVNETLNINPQKIGRIEETPDTITYHDKETDLIRYEVDKKRGMATEYEIFTTKEGEKINLPVADYNLKERKIGNKVYKIGERIGWYEYSSDNERGIPVLVYSKTITFYQAGKSLADDILEELRNDKVDSSIIETVKEDLAQRDFDSATELVVTQEKNYIVIRGQSYLKDAKITIEGKDAEGNQIHLTQSYTTFNWDIERTTIGKLVKSKGVDISKFKKLNPEEKIERVNSYNYKLTMENLDGSTLIYEGSVNNEYREDNDR